MRRLERAGYLDSEWSNAAGRDRRTYRLTEAGRKHLRQRRRDWRRFAEVIQGVLLAG